jgi:hypothetical protein
MQDGGGGGGSGCLWTVGQGARVFLQLHVWLAGFPEQHFILKLLFQL